MQGWGEKERPREIPSLVQGLRDRQVWRDGRGWMLAGSRELAIQTREALMAFLGHKLWWVSVTQVGDPYLCYKS